MNQLMWNDVTSLKGKLPLLDASSTVELSDKRYQSYFSLYGFERLAGLYEQYHFGVIEGDYSFACHWWRSPQSKRTALVVHGLFDHVGLFLPLVENLLKQGLDVIALDLPDHGLSGLEYGSLSNFGVYSDSVASLFNSEQVSIKGPVTLLGQSTGGAVLFDYLANHDQQKQIDQLVLLAPLLRAKGWLGIQLSYYLLGWCIKSVPRGFQQSSHDEAFCDFLRNEDPLQPDFVSIAWVGAMLDWAKNFDAMPEIQVPTLLVQGTKDSTVAFEYNIENYKKKIKDLNLHLVEGARHHLAGEADPWRVQVFSAINKFVCQD